MDVGKCLWKHFSMRGNLSDLPVVTEEGNMSLKNPVTPPGIDPGTIRLVAQRLTHYATPGPSYIYRIFSNLIRTLFTVSEG